MSVSLESLEGLTRRLTITVPSETIDQRVDQELQKLSKKVRLDGFRPGKVPFHVVKKRFSMSVRADILNDVVRDSYIKAIDEQSVKPAGMPTFEPKVDKPGEPFSFTADFEVFPEFPIANFAKIKLERLMATVQDEDIDNAVKRIQQQQSDWQEVAEAIQADDRVTLDYEATVSRKKVETESKEDAQITIGHNIMIEGFEDALIGLKQGDEKKFKLPFPKDYHDEAVKGKKAEFRVTIKKVERKDLPELTEEMIKQAGVEAGTLEALREEIVKNLEREVKYGIKNVLKKRVVEALVEAHKFDVPKALIEQEAQRMKEQNMNYFKQVQPDANIPDFPLDMFNAEAEKNVRVGLIFAEIIDKNELKVEDGMVDERLADIASMYDDNEEAINWIKQNKQQMDQVRSQVIEDQVIDLVVAAAKVAEKSIGAEELIKEAQAR